MIKGYSERYQEQLPIGDIRAQNLGQDLEREKIRRDTRKTQEYPGHGKEEG